MTQLRLPLYQPGARSPKKQRRPAADSPGAIAARERFDAALRAAGEYASMLVHVAVCDLPPAAWQPAIGANGHGAPAEQLRAGLDLLVGHYAAARSLPSELAPAPMASAAARAAV